MELAVFAKKRKTQEGKAFTSYLGKLKRKSDGEEITVQISFREECGSPKADKCPMIIEVPKDKANLTKRNYIKEETGEQVTSHVLWVNEWKEIGKYVDHSLDDYE